MESHQINNKIHEAWLHPQLSEALQAVGGIFGCNGSSGGVSVTDSLQNPVSSRVERLSTSWKMLWDLGGTNRQMELVEHLFYTSLSRTTHTYGSTKVQRTATYLFYFYLNANIDGWEGRSVGLLGWK
jgi:hypothetical protein